MSGLELGPSERRTPLDDSRTRGAAADGGRGIYGIVYVDKLLESTMIATQRERIALRTDEHTVGSHERCALVGGAPPAPAASTLAPEIYTPPPTPWRHVFRRLQPVSPTSAPPDRQYVRVVATHANDASPVHRVFTHGLHTGYDRRCMTVVLIQLNVLIQLQRHSLNSSFNGNGGDALRPRLSSSVRRSAADDKDAPSSADDTPSSSTRANNTSGRSTLRVAPQTRSCVVHI